MKMEKNANNVDNERTNAKQRKNGNEKRNPNDGDDGNENRNINK